MAVALGSISGSELVLVTTFVLVLVAAAACSLSLCGLAQTMAVVDVNDVELAEALRFVTSFELVLDANDVELD